MLALLLDCKGSFADALAAIVRCLRRKRKERESGRDTEMVSCGGGEQNKEMGSFEYKDPAKGLAFTLNGQLLSDLNLKFKFKVRNGREERD